MTSFSGILHYYCHSDALPAYSIHIAHQGLWCVAVLLRVRGTCRVHVACRSVHRLVLLWCRSPHVDTFWVVSGGLTQSVAICHYQRGQLKYFVVHRRSLTRFAHRRSPLLQHRPSLCHCICRDDFKDCVCRDDLEAPLSHC